MHPKLNPRHAVILSALAAAYPAIAYGAGAARVDFATGGVVAQQAPGSSKRSLTKGAEVFPGETIITTTDGMAQLRFTDGSRVSLKPGSEFRIDEYRFSGKPGGEEKGFFSLLKGGFRTITGLVGKSDRAQYQVKTVTATIGIRGTEYSVTYGNSINVNTAEGVVEVCNSAGCLLLYPGDEGYVPDQGKPPVLVQTGEEKPKKDDTPPELSDVEAPANDRNDQGSVAGLVKILTGTQNYRVAWAHQDSGILAGLSGANLPGTIDAEGKLQNFGNGAFSSGSASVSSLGNDGVVTWGRWTASAADMTVNGGNGIGGVVHYAAGVPTLASDPTVPASAGFLLAGGSVSGTSSGTGSISSGSSLGVTFGTGITSLNLGLTVGSNTYLVANAFTLPITTTNGQLEFAGSSASGVTISSSTAACNSGCTGSINGAFFGVGATRAGVSFSFSASGVENITGAAAFKR